MRKQQGYYRCKIKHRKLYLQMKKIFDRLTADKFMRMCLHFFSTQGNEAMNTCVAKYAPKGKTYCSSMSLSNRISIAIGVQNLGQLDCWERLFKRLKMPLGSYLETHLERKDVAKKRKREYESTMARKRKRSQSRQDKMKEQLQKQINDAKRGATYGSRIGMEAQPTLPFKIHPDVMNIEA